MDEIIKIVIERNKERRLLKANDVKMICYKVLKKKGYNFVKHVDIFEHNPNDSTCAGIYYNDNIFFFFNELIELLQRSYDIFSNLYEIDGAGIDIYNYFYLNTIFHELAHVRQSAIINGKHDSLEKKIFKIFFDLSLNRKFYSDNYVNILTEINANNVALVTTNYIYSKLPENLITKKDWKIYQSFLLRTLLYQNYEIVEKKDKIISPAERVMANFDDEVLSLLNITINDCIKLIYNTKNFTIYKKLMLGLPISYLEYAYCDLTSDRLKSNDSINAVKKLQKRLDK